MRNNPVLLIILLSMNLFPGKIIAQEWKLAKEKDGIKIYTRQEQESNFKSFKGETDVRADMAMVSAMIEDVEKFDEWDEDVSEIRILAQEPGKTLKYYVVYDIPWPFQDRDLCVEATISDDHDTGTKLIRSVSATEAVPLKEGTVRIVSYWQNWTIQPKENGLVHLILEGFADPAGDIPSWIANIAITNTPLNILKAIRDKFREVK